MALFRRFSTPFEEDLPDGESAPISGPRSAGDVLRQQREALGLDLDNVAAALRIKPDYLAALEAGCPDLLPGATYAIGFVRTYSDYLGLDDREILRRFRAESTGLDAKPDLAFPMPLSERSIPGGSMVLAALILVLCGYGTWYYLSTVERSRPERVAEVPIGLLAPASAQRAIEAVAPPSAETAAETLPPTPADTGLRTPPPTSPEPRPGRFGRCSSDPAFRASPCFVSGNIGAAAGSSSGLGRSGPNTPERGAPRLRDCRRNRAYHYPRYCRQLDPDTQHGPVFTFHAGAEGR